MNYQQKLYSFLTITKKELVRIFRIWAQTVLSPIITQSLYFLIFGSFLGARIANIYGVPYMSFLVPGLIMMSAINSSFTNTASSFFGSKFQRNIEELLVSPTPNWIIILGFSMGGIFRGLLVGFLVFLISLAFTQISIYNFLWVLVFAFFTTSLFSFAGLLNGILAKKFDDISIFPTFILTPLTYLGGVFYTIEQLPVFWQNVSKFNPIFYMINGFRYGFYGDKIALNDQIIKIIDINNSFLILMISNLCLFYLCLWLLNKGVGLKN